MSVLTLSALRGQRSDEPVGKHWPETVERVAADHLLSPAAYQLVSQTAERVPAGVDEPTGFIDPREVVSTNQWTVRPAAGEAPTEVIPAVTDDPAETAVDQIFDTVMSTEHNR